MLMNRGYFLNQDALIGSNKYPFISSFGVEIV